LPLASKHQTFVLTLAGFEFKIIGKPSKHARVSWLWVQDYR